MGEVEEKSDMISALAVCGLFDEGVGARKSRSKMFEEGAGTGAAVGVGPEAAPAVDA